MTDNDIPENLLKKMRELPPDWWQSESTAVILLDLFRRHIVPLLLAGYVERKFQFTIYTGFLLQHNQNLVWLTAGHAIDELSSILSSPSFEVSKMVWLDDYKAAQSEGVPLHRYPPIMKSWKDTNRDVGAIIPSILDTGNILRNTELQTINAEIWKNLKQANPEGYYAIGFPQPWTQHSQKPAPNNKILHSINANLLCLPLEEVSPPSELANLSGWSDPDVFYGKILPFVDNPTFEVDDLKGMSGGPILSIERDLDGQIRYRLVGIIQSWANSQSIVRAEPVHRIAETIDKWLEEKEPNA